MTCRRLWPVSRILVVAGLVVTLQRGAAADAAPASAGTLPPGPDVLHHIETRPDSPQRMEKLTIQLIDPDGTKRERTARVYRSRRPAEVRILFVFDSPPNIRGTALLIVDHDDPAVDDDRWIYLPALRKTRRIGAGERGQTFLGTDFTYEEIRNDARLQASDMSLEVEAAADHDGRPCLASKLKVTSASYAKDLGYERIDACIDSESWIPTTMNMFDGDGKGVKTIELSHLNRIGDLWLPMHRAARTPEGHQTVLETTSVDVTTPLSDDLFTEDALVRGGH